MVDHQARLIKANNRLDTEHIFMQFMVALIHITKQSQVIHFSDIYHPNQAPVNNYTARQTLQHTMNYNI